MSYFCSIISEKRIVMFDLTTPTGYKKDRFGLVIAGRKNDLASLRPAMCCPYIFKV